MSVEVINVSKKFGNHVALNGVNVSVRSGELMALLGPSGSGKTTLLRIIGGLEFADDRGRVLLHGEDVTTRGAGERQIGFVFQHYALFRHMTVFDNIAFGLNVRPRRCRPSHEQIVEKVRSLLALVQLRGLDRRYPHQLSGGQRQRVALARALAIEPKVLLLDEPFGALDAKVRKELRRWIRRLHNEIHVTSIFVTHDQDEALEVADRVVVMRDAQVEQTGTPNEVYEVPSSPFVYNFLGRVVSLRGDVVNGQLIVGKNAQTLPDRITDGRATIFARPQDIRLAPEANGSLSIEAVVRDVNLAGPVVYLEVERTDDGSILEVEVPIEHSRILQPKSGDLVHVILKDYKVFVDA